MNAEDFMNENPGSWTDAQRKLLFTLLSENNMKAEALERALEFPMSDLSTKEASLLIDCLKNKGDLSSVALKIIDKRIKRGQLSHYNIVSDPRVQLHKIMKQIALENGLLVDKEKIETLKEQIKYTLSDSEIIGIDYYNFRFVITVEYVCIRNYQIDFLKEKLGYQICAIETFNDDRTEIHLCEVD